VEDVAVMLRRALDGGWEMESGHSASDSIFIALLPYEIGNENEYPADVDRERPIDCVLETSDERNELRYRPDDGVAHLTELPKV